MMMILGPRKICCFACGVLNLKKTIEVFHLFIEGLPAPARSEKSAAVRQGPPKAETDFDQTDFGHPYLTDFGQSDFGQTDFGQKKLTDFGQP